MLRGKNTNTLLLQIWTTYEKQILHLVNSGFKQEINIKVPKASIPLFVQQGAQEMVSLKLCLLCLI